MLLNMSMASPLASSQEHMVIGISLIQPATMLILVMAYRMPTFWQQTRTGME